MKSTAELANSVKVKVTKHGIKILAKDADLTFAGAGRSAVVFKVEDKALKVFFPGYTHTAKEEAAVYKALQENDHFPKMYEAGEHFLLIDYIEGTTLFDCLTKGIRVTESVINDIDQALLYAQQRGLNPSDVHLRNIIVTAEGKVRLIDVARFRQTKDCRQWKDLKKAFFKLYNKAYFPKRIPGFILNMIALLYKKRFPQIAFVCELL